MLSTILVFWFWFEVTMLVLRIMTRGAITRKKIFKVIRKDFKSMEAKWYETREKKTYEPERKQLGNPNEL